MSKGKDPKDLGQTSVKPDHNKLPKEIQKLLDAEEDSLLDQIYDGTANATTDSNLRYAAYASRFRTILLSAHRYVAYTSDIGESFRPVANPWLIRSAYGVSWAYLIGDVTHEGYKARIRNQQTRYPLVKGEIIPRRSWDGRSEKNGGPPPPQEPGHVPPIDDYRVVMLQRAIFQSVASMGLPAFTIHSIVKSSGKALKDAKNVKIRTYGPIGLGLAAVPFLPFFFDKPVENAVEWGFYKAFETFLGPESVDHRPKTGREKDLQLSNRKTAKEKEL